MAGLASVEPVARLAIAAVTRGEVRPRQPDPVVLGRGLGGLVEERLHFLGGDDHRVEPPVLAECIDPVAERPGSFDLVEQPADLHEPPLPEQQFGERPAGFDGRGTGAARRRAVAGLGVRQPAQRADEEPARGEVRHGGSRRARRHPAPDGQGRFRMSQLRLARPEQIRHVLPLRPPGGEPRQPVARQGILLRVHPARGPPETVANLPTADQQPADPAENRRQQTDGDAGDNPGSNHRALNWSRSRGNWPEMTGVRRGVGVPPAEPTGRGTPAPQGPDTFPVILDRSRSLLGRRCTEPGPIREVPHFPAGFSLIFAFFI